MARASARRLWVATAALLLAACGPLIHTSPPAPPPDEFPSASQGRLLGEDGEPVAGAEMHFRGRLHGTGRGPELRLPRGRPLRVRVEDSEGHAVAGATVGLFPEPRRMPLSCYPWYLRMESSATTAEDGTCTFDGLGQRLYRVVATAHGAERGAVTAIDGATEVRVVLGTAEGHRRFSYLGLPEEEETPDRPRGERWPLPDPPPPDDALEEGTPTSPEPDEPTPVPPDELIEEEEEEPEAPDPRARLVARVFSADGVPMPRVFVTLRWAEHPGRDFAIGQNCAGPEYEGCVGTEVDGRAVLFLDPGRYELTASPVDFRDAAIEARAIVDATAGEEPSIEVRFESVFSVPLETVDYDGLPLPGAMVEVFRGEESTLAWTGAYGRKTLFADRNFPLRIVLSPDEGPDIDSGLIALPVDGPVALRGPKSERIGGRVLDPDGVPLSGVNVTMRREGMTPPEEKEWTDLTDELGEFALFWSAEGEHTVEAWTHGFRATAETGVRIPGTAPVEIRLRAPVRVRGRILGADGEPLACARIDVGGRRGESVSAAFDGTFAFDWREASDEATITVSAQGHRTREVPVSVEYASPLEIRLERAP